MSKQLSLKQILLVSITTIGFIIFDNVESRQDRVFASTIDKDSYIRKIPKLEKDPLYPEYKNQLDELKKQEKRAREEGFEFSRIQSYGYQLSKEFTSTEVKKNKQDVTHIERELLKDHYEGHLPEIDAEEEKLIASFREEMESN